MKGKSLPCFLVFSGMLLGCGHSTDVTTTSDLASASTSTPTPTDTPTSSASQAVVAPTDPVSKAMVMIDSPQYQGQLIFNATDYSTVQTLQKKYPDIIFKSKFGDPVQLDRERRRLEVVVGKKLPDLRRHVIIDSGDRTKAKEILQKIAGEKGVESFYPKLEVPAPGSLSNVPDLTGLQGYLNDLNIPTVWATGIAGQNTTIVDDEDGWNTHHKDIPAGLVDVDVSDRGRAHGTAVLGILGGLDNRIGVKGIVPEAELATSDLGFPTTRSPNGIGNVYLLEQGYANPFTFPVDDCNDTTQVGCANGEFYPDHFESFKLATAFGRTIIHPAGNGNINMDTTTYVSGWPNLSRDDSGAIIVGASQGANHTKASFGNCGRRVNLFAWGQGVVTTSYPCTDPYCPGWSGANNPNIGDPDLYFTNQFGGTSSAGAIIAGTASLLQSYAKSKMGLYKSLTPLKLREILVNSGIPANGTNGCNIGTQPRMDVAMSLFDNFWTSTQQSYPEINRRQAISGNRRKALHDLGIQMKCEYHRPDLSDPNCAETAQCVLLPQPTPHQTTACQGSSQPDCLDIDFANSDYDCAAGSIWPTGVTIAKPLDFDGDGKADLVNWTETGWQIALSSKGPIDASRTTWDYQINVPMNIGRWVWPVVDDYNSDGRADLAVWDKEHGVWYIAFTNSTLVNNGTWHGWDKQVPLNYHDELNRDVHLTKYSRPVEGDYNGDGWIDLALQTSDGYWRIAWGNKDFNYNRNFDINLKYLTDAQLAEAPGWAYLPTPEVSFWNGAGVTFKVPDGITGAGELWFVSMTGLGSSPYWDINDRPVSFNGNESIPVKGDILKTSEGNWFEFDAIQEKVLLTTPAGIYGGLDCHPFMADYDGDGKLDRVVQCPTEFRTVMSSDGSVHHIPFGYDVTKFSLPGKVYFGGISYQTVQQLIDYQLQISPDPPVIPVDMVQSQPIP